ncbi:calcium-translocating P-type ATPase, PMCA-type family protein [Trichomonas vaginalis G3]|uniref:Calcium-transporting ATPase n=1 Tax=Trichomonas vaginalis (strain ATCC PRA-98 / G3) TaxID=412133 RepID=A2FF20_TRIV3|nr:calcium-transporting ATPase protein [Trichomonas vaginalis G3]EAX96478.1 calcium-translocating P-type ATPase, PMCA-type family protein [Trichomonas vaginalis G3]KAI5552088.1 calcium-transporting ATPase protein [Trichomonas vaginalis G3]|eukprot:XP_001309408.1 calcium-translocating P-type ATPase, PMCA-type family protein [Trichomonas vaginalis G3]
MEIETKEIINIFERSDLEFFESKGGLDGFCNAFHTNLTEGIPKSEAAEGFADRIAGFGVNKLPDPPVKTWCRMFLEALNDLTLKILLIVAVIAAVVASAAHHKHLTFEHYIDPISILIAVFVVAIVSAQTNYSQQKAYLEINSLKNNFPVTVIRAGEKQQIMSTEVLVGDILEIKAGDCVAADALFINGTNVSINNSAQTGEPIAVKINEKNPFLRGGGAIESGIGTCLVAAVGPNSQYGVTMMQIQELEAKDDKTPLEKKLDKLSLYLTYLAIFSGILIFVILFIIWIVNLVKAKKKGDLPPETWDDLSNLIMTSLTIFICCIPEGLPLAVTLSLSFSMKKMMNDNNFVRHLNACETMGGATTICSDKTGTLTQNKMTVVKYYMYDEESDGKPELNEQVLKLLADSIAINSTASHTIKEGSEEPIFVGSSSECALLKFIGDFGQDYVEIRELNPIKYLNEFNSARKRMSTVVEGEHGLMVYLKGAPDFCLPLMKNYLTPEGDVKEVDDDFTNAVMGKVNDFASQAYRTMLIAFRNVDHSMEAEIEDPALAEKDMTFICIVGIQDPLRPEVPDAIKKCEDAGVVVRMVTGDFIATARAISKQCGILKKETDIVMEGAEFAKMSKTDLLDKIDNLRVLARSSPTDKYRLVSLLMECGEVVAVTGDGSNDSAALKKANVGLSMGMCGTELAKIASDIVILDDNFSSIVSALKWGRCVYDNLRSFMQFQLPVNFVAVIVVLIGSIYLNTSPLKPIQILWINLINDSLGALGLATRPPSDSLLKRHPYGEGDNLISNVIARNMSIQTVYQTIVLLLILFGRQKLFGVPETAILGEKYETTVSWIFNTFVFMNVFNLINSRVAGHDGSVFDGIQHSFFFILVFFGIAAIQILIIFVGGKVFHTVQPTGREWWITMVFSVGDLIVGFFTRMIKLKDHTLENLNVYRLMRKEKVRRYYHNMSVDQQWNENNVLSDSDELKEVETHASSAHEQSETEISEHLVNH